MSPLPSSRTTTAFPGSVAVSMLLHGAALVVLAQLFAPPLPPLATIIPVSLVSLPGGGGGPKGEDVGPPPGPVVARDAGRGDISASGASGPGPVAAGPAASIR